MSTPRSSQTFCARPGCGLARSGHGFLAGACSNFIQPGSKEAHEAKRAHLAVVETPAPVDADELPHRFVPSGVPITGEPGEQWCALEGCVVRAAHLVHIGIDPCAPDTTLPIDGNVLDRVLLAGALEHQNEAIETAKQHLVTGLRSQRAGMPKFALECFTAALAALGNLGAA